MKITIFTLIGMIRLIGFNIQDIQNTCKYTILQSIILTSIVIPVID